MDTPRYRFLMRTKVLGYGKLVSLEADRDLEVDSKHQDKSRYRLSDTGMLLLNEEMTRRREEMRRQEEQMQRGRQRN
jgi:hypothetical protein